MSILQFDTPGIDSALERKQAFAGARGNESAAMFPNLRLFVVTCLDLRVDPAHFLGLDLGDAMVVRNVGGRVTPEVINDVAFIGQIAENVLPDGETVVPGAAIGARDLPEATLTGPDGRSADPTQGRRIGSRPYDDPAQGRRLGSRSRDDPTRPR